jgi:hydroxymethylbilane synthase
MSTIPIDTDITDNGVKGWFTKEIETELIDKHIDLAVHSLKDLPEILPEGLMISAIPQRGDVRDVLISKNNIKLQDLKEGSVIGTDSIRRKIQILAINPKLIVKSIRGNINRRLEKLQQENYDALILAAAGIQRIGLENIITEYFDPKIIIPAPGQGALVIETRIEDNHLNQVLSQISDMDTSLAVSGERAFANYIGGGCQFPIGSYAEYDGNKLILHGMLGSLDGTKIIKDFINGDLLDSEKLGKKLAIRMLDNMANYE